MTIGSSPFLSADVDDVMGLGASRSSELHVKIPGDIVSARLELIRRRVLSGYYCTPAIAAEIARRLLEERSQDK
jgi:hypothetical protein